MPDGLSRLYLSPHFDDVVLSCGASLAAAMAAGETCRVLTVFAGEPQLEAVSEAAAILQREWGVRGDVAGALDAVRARRAEDEEALRRLGVQGQYLDELDCIYRRTRDGSWRIEDGGDVFRGLTGADEPVTQGIRAKLEAVEGVDDRTTIYVPLAVGRHCDHEVVRAAAEDWRPRQLCYYEDFPYVVHPGQLAARLGELSGWEAELEFVSNELFMRRFEAALAYASQVPFLFGDEVGLERAMRAYALECGITERGLAERRWRPAAGAELPRVRDERGASGGVSGHGLRGA